MGNWYKKIHDLGIRFCEYIPHIDYDDAFEDQEFRKYCQASTPQRVLMDIEYRKRQEFITTKAENVHD